MKILRIISTMDPAYGGPCQGIRNSESEFRDLGIHDEIVSLDDPLATYLHSEAIQVKALGPSYSRWQYSSKFIPWLLDNLSRFDVVIVHGLWLYHSYGTFKALEILKRKSAGGNRKYKIPKFYVMPHGMLDPYFQSAPDRRIKALRNRIYWKLIERRIVNEADGLLFTCEKELELARQTFRPYNPKRELNVSYGIENPRPYSPEMKDAFLKKCPQLTNDSYFLFLGRIHKKKGIDLLIKAYKEIYYQKFKKGNSIRPANPGDKTPGKDSRDRFPLLVIAGPGFETAYGRELKQLISMDDELKPAVHFIDMLSGNAKWGAFYGCDAFVLPSHQENFGIAVVESLACGKPVLISNQVNICNEIEKSGGGFVADDTVAGTRTLLENWDRLDSKQRQEMGRHAKRFFHERFSVSSSVKNLLEAISN